MISVDWTVVALCFGGVFAIAAYPAARAVSFRPNDLPHHLRHLPTRADILRGAVADADFAADLASVVSGAGSPACVEAAQFPMPAVNPAILLWARESAGLSMDEAADKLQLKGAYGRTPIERLEELESGDREPSRPMLVKMAKQYRRPLVAFYLSGPPRPGDRGTDFRTLSGAGPKDADARVQILVRQVLARQSLLREVLAEDEADEVAFVDSLTLDDGRQAALDSVHRILGSSHPGQARNPTQAFDRLREAAHEAGAFVLLKGDLGNYRTAIDTNTFRGLALADRLAPFIVINDNDARTAWSFTLVHELVHLLLGNTGVSAMAAYHAMGVDNHVERFCNDVASAFLLPEEALAPLEARGLEYGELADVIGKAAQTHNVSRTLVAYRLFQSGRIVKHDYERLAAAFRTRWLDRRATRREASRAADGGPSYYKVRRHRVGKALVEAVRRAQHAGDLPTTRAAVVLGVKPTQVGAMLSA